MNIEEIALKINKICLAESHVFSSLQKIREKYYNKRPNTWKPFVKKSIKANYAFHSGGREEMQFNIGEDYINGKNVFRYGIAFSLKENQSLKDAIGVFKNPVLQYNIFIKNYFDFFNGFSYWYYIGKDFGEYYNSVQTINDKEFKAGNFIFIGKYIEKDISKISIQDINSIVELFDYLIPAYEAIQFGKPSIEKRISRLAFNTKGWVEPSGPEGKSTHKNSHEAKYGYGHEEWLFDTSKTIAGYHYGFLEPIRKQQAAYKEKTFNVWLYTIDGISKKRYWVGEINNLEVITPEHANEIKQKYEGYNWLKEMKEQITSSGANNIGFSDWEGINLFNVRYKPIDLLINDDYVELPDLHPVIEQSRYTFSHFRDEFTINRNDSFDKHIDEEDDDETIIETSLYQRKPKAIEIIHLHKAISKKLTKKLKEIYGSKNVKAEETVGIGSNRIDIRVNSESEGLTYYEIKTYNSVKTSIREAIGQLFEYSMWPNNTKANQLVVLTQKQSNLDEVKSYFEHLRKKLSLSIYYQWFDIESNELSQKY